MKLLLNGGGLDSIANLILLRDKEIACLHVNYGQISAEREKEAVEYFSKKYNKEFYSINVSNMGEFLLYHPLFNKKVADRGEYVLHARNLFLASVGIMIAANNGMNEVLFSFHKEPDMVYLDAREEFLDKINDICNYLKLDLKVGSEFARVDRDEVIRRAYKVDKELFTKSWSCYKDCECGVCPHCKQKEEIMRKCAE